MRKSDFILIAALCASSASFSGAAADTSTPAHASLRAAVAVAEAHARSRFAFTAIYADLKAEPGKTFELRFDPRLPEGERWTAVSPPADALSREERKRFKNLRKSNDADDGLIYEGLAPSIGEARLVSEDDAVAVFAAPIRDEETPRAVAEAVELTLVLDKKGGFIRTVVLKSKAPFKPAPPARVERMEQTQIYEPLDAGGPALMRTSESIAVGEAMFKKFDQHVRMDYRDFEAVPAAAVAGGK